MANQNNLIRPPVLNSNQAPGNQVPNQQNITAEIEAQIINLVRRTYEEEQQDRNREEILVDQGINTQYNNNLTDLDKITDIVECLREFSGSPTEFGSWKKSVESP